MPRDSLLAAAARLRKAVEPLGFAKPVTHVYNPLVYAWSAHESYLRRFGAGRRRILFVGMNPGPFGMAQTGVPFGQVTAVRDWLRIDAAIGKPPNEHPKRRVTGLACSRNEISGERLWGLFARRFGQAEDFFREHFVMNYCPLVFLESSGRNRTPDKLPAAERAALFALCDEHLRAVVRILRPDWLVGIGRFASRQAEAVTGLRVVRILHPSPANPAANVDWAGTVMAQLRGYGVWP